LCKERKSLKGDGDLMSDARLELHAVSSGEMSLHNLVQLAQGIHPYVTAIQIREPGKTAYELMLAVKSMVDKGVPIHKIRIHDRVDVAIASGVGGIHLAGHSLPVRNVKELCGGPMRIGVSIHSVEEAISAEREGASYVTYGHVYTTNSKPGLEPRGLSRLAQVTRAVNLPVIAIGGIKPAQVKEVMESGTAGVAVISGIVGDTDPVNAARRYAKALEQAGSLHSIYLRN
jgi:thiazole tautomerase (transcriptional regulator TenI)